MLSAKRVGGQLQSIKQPQKVKVLILSENRTTAKDFYLINNFTKLIKIDLSYNKINSFPAGFTFNQFTHLRTLFLHYNKFSVIKNLMLITQCQSIQYLTLFGNPLQQGKARHFFVNQMPNLMLMDDKIVRLQQRNQNFSIGENTTQLLSFPLVPISHQPSSSIYIENLVKELTLMRSAYLKANPIVRIQRWWRHLQKNKKTKWNPSFSPRQKSIQRQSTIKDYKNDLDRLTTQKMQVSKSGEEIVASLLYQNYQFWRVMSQIVEESKIFLSRQFCKLRAIQFVQIQNLLFLRQYNNIPLKSSHKRINLLLLQHLHHSLIIKKHKKVQIKAKDISMKICQVYKINRKKFMNKQDKLIKRQETYCNYVVPLLSKTQLMAIIKKQYRKFILSKNKSEALPFVIYKLAERSIAAVNIQRYWKGYKIRKNFNAYLKIKEKECAVRIQRWVRRLKFIHRHKFLLEVSHYLKREKSNEIILEMSQIEAIQSYCTYKEHSGINLVIPFQNCQFNVVKNAVRSTERIIFYSERKPYPSYINLTFQNDLQKRRNKYSDRSNILQILFKEVKDIIKVTDNKGTKYVKFVYQSNEQALNRKFILALKTYRMINHQFIHSKQANNLYNPNSVIEQVNQQKLISMVYDNDNNRVKGSIQELSKKLQNSKSQSSINTDIALISNTLCIKIKYYIVKNDVSCTLFIKQTKYQLAHRSKEASSLNLNQFYLGKKSMSKRYGEESNNGDMYSKISRNIMSLNDFEGLLSRESQRKSTQRKQTAFNKILNTDQSHTIIGSISHQNSLKKLQGYRKMQSFDRFDRQVYPPLTEVVRQSILYEKFIAHREELLHKKQKIEQIKSSHRKNVAYMNSRKTQNLQNLRRSVAKQSEENVKKIDQARTILQFEKMRKHDRIKEHFKSPSNNFEREFLKKGIHSIKKEFREYEKHRSFRQSSEIIQNQKSRLANSKAGNILKTEMKEFSINFSQVDFGAKLSEQSLDLKNQAHMRQLLKRSIQNYQSRDNSHSHSEINETIRVQQQPVNKAQQLQRKKIRKKRLVHSVFPQQFYPIRQSNQIGFELPKIGKK